MRSRTIIRFPWLALPALLALAACPATSEEVRPPDDQLFFPSGLAIDPAEEVLFVANANSELRYDSGTIVTLDLDRVEALLGPWLADGTVPTDPDGCEDCCEPDPSSPVTLICNEKAAAIPGAVVRIGNFASQIAVQELAGGDYRLFSPVRGDPSITYIDYDRSERTLSCGGGGRVPLCDNEFRLDRLGDAETGFGLSDEPWGIYADSTNGYVVVTHLTLGTVSLIDAPPDGSAPELVDAIGGLFITNPQTGARGATGVAGRLPGSDDDIIYVTSRAEARVQMLTVHRPSSGNATLVPGEFFFLDRFLPSDDARGIGFSADGNRGYFINRDPPTLQIVDTSIGATGFPSNDVIGAAELCRNASVLTVGDPGAGERAYVSCFQDSRIWVIDTERAELLGLIDAGRGANASALAADRGRLYVSNFLEDTISIIDVQPGSPTENRVVMQLGRERQSGGE
jgi:DNA-binding beta-propeller fold protein YncE